MGLILINLEKMGLNCCGFKSGGLHEKHAVATGNHLSICPQTQEQPTESET
jgi:hypothetical protein